MLYLLLNITKRFVEYVVNVTAGCSDTCSDSSSDSCNDHVCLGNHLHGPVVIF